MKFHLLIEILKFLGRAWPDHPRHRRALFGAGIRAGLGVAQSGIGGVTWILVAGAISAIAMGLWLAVEMRDDI